MPRWLPSCPLESPSLSRRALVRASLSLCALTLLSACGANRPATVAPSTAVSSGSVQATTVATSTTAQTTVAAPTPTSAPTAVPAAQQSAGAAVPVLFWGISGPNEPGPTDDQLVTEFNQTHQGVRVTLEQVPPVGIIAGDKLVTAMASGTGPDALYLGRHLIPNFAWTKGIAALDSYANAQAFQLDDFYPRFIDESKWRGKLYGIPYNPDARGLYWNKSLFQTAGLPADRPPNTWDDLQAATATLTKKSASGDLTQLGYVPGWLNPPTYLGWYVYLWQLGGEFLTPDHRTVAYNSREGVQALQTMVDQMQQAGGYTAVQQLSKAASVPTGLDMFSAGHLAMAYATNGAMSAYDKVKSLDYGIAPFPIPSGGPHVNYSGGFDLTLTAAAKHPAEAWQLIDYLVSPQPLLRFNLAGHTIPARKSVANSTGYLSANPRLKFFTDELPFTRWVPVIVGITEIFDVNNTMYTDAISGKSSAADAVAASVPRVQAILAKYADDQ